MPMMTHAARAYESSSGMRNLRDQEADIFRRANAALRYSRSGNTLARVRALADNNRLWITVIDLVRDPANQLPEPLRASIVSVGMAVQREIKSSDPDIDFLLSVNDNMVAGLTRQR